MESTLSYAVPYARRWAALAVICTAQFMVIMDTSIIGVALPAIQKDLGYSSSDLQWIFNAYVIFLGGLLLLGGKLSDLFGPRKIFMYGFGILTLASLLAGLAWSETSMNIGRALQGAGSALIAPSALTLLLRCSQILKNSVRHSDFGAHPPQQEVLPECFWVDCLPTFSLGIGYFLLIHH